MKRRGYTLIELAAAMAIAAIVATGAISTFAVVNRSVVQLRTEAQAENKLQRILSFLVADAQELGGGSIRPWFAVYVHPGKAGAPDAMLQFTADTDVTPCSILRYRDGDGQLEAAAGERGACCMVDGGDPGEENEPFFRGRFAVLTKGTNSVVVSLRTLSLGSCTAKVDPFFIPESTDASGDFAGGTLSVVDSKWIYLDQGTHRLMASILSTYDHFPSIAAAEMGEAPRDTLPIRDLIREPRIIATDVYDLQFALGYDKNFDGTVTESVGGSGDEWLGNSAGDIDDAQLWVGDNLIEHDAAVADDATFAFARDRFRMVEVGVILGLPMKIAAQRDGSWVLDGSPVSAPKLYLRGGSARAMLRNSGVYE